MALFKLKNTGDAPLDDSSLERLAELICGDRTDSGYHPSYRSSYYLTQFFQRCELPRYEHQGETRNRWALESLRECNCDELCRVIHRLVDPREYAGDETQLKLALTRMNEILHLERLEARVEQGRPKIYSLDEATAARTVIENRDPLPPPDFNALQIEADMAALLTERWREISACLQVDAPLAALILIGSTLEGMLAATVKVNWDVASQHRRAPRDRYNNRVRPADRWDLSPMIDIASDLKWIGTDVSKFSHSLREFRNTIHPSNQLQQQFNPDIDSCKILGRWSQPPVTIWQSSLSPHQVRPNSDVPPSQSRSDDNSLLSIP